MTDNKCSADIVEFAAHMARLLYNDATLDDCTEAQKEAWLNAAKAMMTIYDVRSRGAAQKPQQPVAWVMPGDDNARDNGSIDAMAWQDGEFSKPLYAAPTQTPPDEEILSLVRVWRECPAERRPSAAALADRIIETLSLSSTEGNTK